MHNRYFNIDPIKIDKKKFEIGIIKYFPIILLIVLNPINQSITQMRIY